jgi:hypothetical protein
MSKNYTTIVSNGKAFKFPNVPKPTTEQLIASLPSVPTHTPVPKQINSSMTSSQRADLERKAANAFAISNQINQERKLESNLASIRKEEEARQAMQAAKDDAELEAEFAKLEKQYPQNCKKDKKGKCTIMGGKYKTRKSRKGKKKGKSAKRRNKK